jgi:type IV secretion system protein VirB1
MVAIAPEDVLLGALPSAAVSSAEVSSLAPVVDRQSRTSRPRRERADRRLNRNAAAPEAQTGAHDSAPISPGLLVRLINACAPKMNPVTQAAVISVESSGDAWALHDDNDDRVYRPRSFTEAVQLANRLIANNRVHYGGSDAGVDVGVAQINSNNFAALGVDAGWMLHPCPNLRVSSTMLADAYNVQYASLAGMPDPDRDRLAMRRALQVYNSGKPYGDDSYVANVLVALHSDLVQRMRQVAYQNPIPPTRIMSVPLLPLSARMVDPNVRPGSSHDAPGTASARSDSALFVHEDLRTEVTDVTPSPAANSAEEPPVAALSPQPAPSGQ